MKDEITDLESARKKTLIFKQFIAQHTSVDMKRYNIAKTKLEKLAIQKEQRYKDARYGNYTQWTYDNSDIIHMLEVFKGSESILKKLYKQKKQYQLGKDYLGDELSREEVKEELLNIKLQINQQMRQTTNNLRWIDESDKLDLGGSWYTIRDKESIRNIN